MRKKHLLTKALTLVLSAAICAGGTGLETLAASVEITQKRMFLPMNLMKSFALCRAQHIFWFLWETTSLI